MNTFVHKKFLNFINKNNIIETLIMRAKLRIAAINNNNKITTKNTHTKAKNVKYKLIINLSKKLKLVNDEIKKIREKLK